MARSRPLDPAIIRAIKECAVVVPLARPLHRPYPGTPHLGGDGINADDLALLRDLMTDLP